MGLVELSLVSQEPPYWGWLKPLFLEDLDAAINAANPDHADAASVATEPVAVTLHRLQGALQFTEAPHLFERLSSALEKNADVETLVVCAKTSSPWVDISPGKQLKP